MVNLQPGWLAFKLVKILWVIFTRLNTIETENKKRANFNKREI